MKLLLALALLLLLLLAICAPHPGSGQPWAVDLGHALRSQGFNSSVGVAEGAGSGKQLHGGPFNPDVPYTSFMARYGLDPSKEFGPVAGGDGTSTQNILDALAEGWMAGVLPPGYQPNEQDRMDILYVAAGPQNVYGQIVYPLSLRHNTQPGPSPSPTADPRTTPPPSCLTGECRPECPANCASPTPAPTATPLPTAQPSPSATAAPTPCPPAQQYVELPIPVDVLQCAMGFAGIHVTAPWSVVTWRAQRQACAQTINNWLHGLPTLYVPSVMSTGVTSQVVQ